MSHRALPSARAPGRIPLHAQAPSRPAGETLPGRPALLLLALTGALLLFRLGALPLLGPDEPRYTRVAIEMHRAGDPVLPTLQGQPWLEKPPLFYWVAGLFFSVLGETESAARMPSIIATLVMVGWTALLGARLYGRAAGLHAGFIVGTSILIFVYGRAAAMDMLVAACVSLSIGFLALRTLGVAGTLAVPAAWIFAAVGTLGKGPLGVLLPALVFGVFILLGRDWGGLRRAVSPWGAALFLLIAAPWYVLMWRREGESFVDTFLLQHNVERFLTTVHHHPGGIFYYVPLIVAGLFPWSALLVPALVGLRAVRSRTDRFVLVWFLAPLLFFTAAGSKLPGYILPCLPPLAILMGRSAAEAARGEVSRVALRAGALLGVALGALVACLPIGLFRTGDPGWAAALPLGLWGLIVTLLFSRRVSRDAMGSIALLRVGGAGLLLLLALAAPDILARRESGRSLFLPARGREVLAFGAWRTAWMAGYFYNDGRVREVLDLKSVTDATGAGPVLVLVGPVERRLLERLPALKCLLLAEGPRENALLRVERR
jgi:4-amino-4-deoxy-L-arabinose transferase-like glycosyltransferase